jgi:outer membrane immunogenic protein
MPKFAVAVAAVITFTGASALAADMSVKVPRPLPAIPVPNWTGFYLGGALGGKWGDTTWTTASDDATAAGIPGCTIQCFPGAPGPGVDVSSVKMGWDASIRARLG